MPPVAGLSFDCISETPFPCATPSDRWRGREGKYLYEVYISVAVKATISRSFFAKTGASGIRPCPPSSAVGRTSDVVRGMYDKAELACAGDQLLKLPFSGMFAGQEL